MYDTRNIDAIAAALADLTGCLNSPRQDEVLLRAAGVSLDRALFPLLVRLGFVRSTSIARLADQVGRDASTVSRQIAKLEQIGLVRRPSSRGDQRLREVAINAAGLRTVAAISTARQRLLNDLLRGWSADERRQFPLLLQRLADAMKQAQTPAGGKSARRRS